MQLPIFSQIKYNIVILIMKLERCSPNMKHINTLNKFQSAFCFKLFTSNASRVILKVVDFIDSVICNFTIMRIVNNVFTAFEIIQVAISDMVIDSIFCHKYLILFCSIQILSSFIIRIKSQILSHQKQVNFLKIWPIFRVL